MCPLISYPKEYPFLPEHTVQQIGRDQFEVRWGDGKKDIVGIDPAWVVTDDFYDAHEEAVKMYVGMVCPKMWNRHTIRPNTYAWLAVAIDITRCCIDTDRVTRAQINEQRIHELVKDHL